VEVKLIAGLMLGLARVSKDDLSAVLGISSSPVDKLGVTASGTDSSSGGYKDNASMEGALDMDFTPSVTTSLLSRDFSTGLRAADSGIMDCPTRDTVRMVSLPEEQTVVTEGVGSVSLCKLMEL